MNAARYEICHFAFGEFFMTNAMLFAPTLKCCRRPLYQAGALCLPVVALKTFVNTFYRLQGFSDRICISAALN
ncbi:MAG: hypothetical protein D6790_19915 [Caldilineae bacterium]|nr:MAG: hypothetical protein D6790_19915 [Caldilineae bacterium]